MPWCTTGAHQQESQAPVSQGFAADLGLDLEQYDPDVPARVRADVEDGLALGVSGTPTFLVGGEPVRPATVEDVQSAVDEALDAS